MKITVLSRYEMMSIRDNVPDCLSGLNRVISINDPGHPEVFYDVKEHPNLLTLFFDDIERLYNNRDDLWLFSDSQAEQVIDFLDYKVDSDSNLIVHCTAGISRSGAVAKFAAEYLDYDMDLFYSENRQIQPNCHVLTTLRRVAKLGYYGVEQDD